MTKKINPFNPNSPINPGMFVGRVEEIDRLKSFLIQTKADQPMHFMITGERGIGKTSLLMYLRYIARGDIPLDDETLRYLIVDVDIGPSTTQLGLMKRIELGISRELGKSEPARNFLKEVWSFLKRVKIADCGINEKVEYNSIEVMLDEFAYSVAQVVNRTCVELDQSIFNAKCDGLLIMIDEADNSPKELQLGSFIKLLLERLQKHDCTRVITGLAGLSELRNKLHDSHPSSLRIFEDIILERLSDNEVSNVIDLCLKKANANNEVKTTIKDGARSLLIELSEGYPHFIQQFGYSAFSKDTDGLIDEKDVYEASLEANGALELIGNRYYRNAFYNKIQKESYRQVLRIMADKLDIWVPKNEIRKKFKGNDAILNNALKALRDRHIILSKEGEKGIYRLQHKGFALWIKLYADPDLFKKAK